MSESKNKIDFKMLDYERVGGDFVAFKLEDGALVKVKGDFDIKEREILKRLIKERFNIEDSRMIFVKIPIMDKEQANVTILVNTKAIGPKILEVAREAEEAWDAYKDEYGRWGMTTEDFKQSLMDVVHQFSQ